MRSAVLYLVFNRPKATKISFETLRQVQPPRLYIAADGPREQRPDDDAACREVKEIVASVDWPCVVTTLFRERNLGCRMAVSSALDWFFSQEEQGVIVEDDVLILPSYFEILDALLDKYRDEPTVAMIGACNFVAQSQPLPASYAFSKYCHVWGWATWRRAWQTYDVTMSSWPEWDKQGGLQKLADVKGFETYWRRVFDDVYAGRVDTWDYQWVYACWRSGSLAIVPCAHQVTNIGFDAQATHTSAGMPGYASRAKVMNIQLPLSHPNEIRANEAVDKAISRQVFGIAVWKIAVQKLKDVIKWFTRRC